MTIMLQDLKLKIYNFHLLAIVLLYFLFNFGAKAQEYTTLKIKPSATDANITNCDIPHIIMYNPKLRNNKLLLWLTGTNGTSEKIPKDFVSTALEASYRVISLSFISTPGGNTLCAGKNLKENRNCYADFRQYRIYGNNNFPQLKDQPQDAIVNRLKKLFAYLINNNSTDNWQQYFDARSGKIKWENIAIAGQSQGGGMAEYIGQRENVGRIISFSGGWDVSDGPSKTIADWYSQPCVTPSSHWFATYHVKEAETSVLTKICNALPIPKNQVFALAEPLPSNMVIRSPNPYHGQGISNIIYKPIWQIMLGSGL